MNPDDVQQARKLGAFAAQTGKPLTACPFDTGQGRRLAAAWVRGFLHWRPDVAARIDHTGPRP